MMLVDSDILIDFARKESKAVEFLDKVLRDDNAHISIISNMELLVGCRNKREVMALGKFVKRFTVVPVTTNISEGALDLLKRYRSSHGLLIPDSMIAATALELSLPLATKNRRDFIYIDGIHLAVY